MRPIPGYILILLMLSLCGLCVWQWSRETELRKISAQQREEITALQSEQFKTEASMKAADAEILRLTASLAELRTNSIAKEEFDALTENGTKMREGIEKLQAAIKERDGALAKLNTSMQQANDQIKKLISERDSVATRLQEVTQKYNKLANPSGN